jgi:hypothetical protein
VPRITTLSALLLGNYEETHTSLTVPWNLCCSMRLLGNGKMCGIPMAAFTRNADREQRAFLHPSIAEQATAQWTAAGAFVSRPSALLSARRPRSLCTSGLRTRQRQLTSTASRLPRTQRCSAWRAPVPWQRGADFLGADSPRRAGEKRNNTTTCLFTRPGWRSAEIYARSAKTRERRSAVAGAREWTLEWGEGAELDAH